MRSPLAHFFVCLLATPDSIHCPSYVRTSFGKYGQLWGVAGNTPPPCPPDCRLQAPATVVCWTKQVPVQLAVNSTLDLTVPESRDGANSLSLAGLFDGCSSDKHKLILDQRGSCLCFDSSRPALDT